MNKKRLNVVFTPGNGNVGLLQSNLGGALGGRYSGFDPLAELGGADEEEMLLLVGRDEDVVLVLPLLSRPVLGGTVHIFSKFL